MRTLLEVTYINIHGETMSIKLTEDLKKHFSHNDCNNGYEDLDNLFTTIKLTPKFKKILNTKKDEMITFGYILNESEKAILDSFIVSSDLIIKEREELKELQIRLGISK